MNEEPFKYHNELKVAYGDISEQMPDAFFSSRVMAELRFSEHDASGLGHLAERLLGPAFITLGVSLASCVYLVLLASNMFDSLELFSAMGLLNGDFGL
jgi:hypothetical protein